MDAHGVRCPWPWDKMRNIYHMKVRCNSFCLFLSRVCCNWTQLFWKALPFLCRPWQLLAPSSNLRTPGAREGTASGGKQFGWHGPFQVCEYPAKACAYSLCLSPVTFNNKWKRHSGADGPTADLQVIITHVFYLQQGSTQQLKVSTLGQMSRQWEAHRIIIRLRHGVIREVIFLCSMVNQLLSHDSVTPAPGQLQGSMASIRATVDLNAWQAEEEACQGCIISVSSIM